MKQFAGILLLPLGMAAIAAAAPPTSTAAPTFNRDIAPILYANCATCHRPGEVAPFPLLTYQDASKRAALIAGAVSGRFMPPWKAEPGYGDFAGERRLTEAQIALIKDWAKAGAPEGDLAKIEARPPPQIHRRMARRPAGSSADYSGEIFAAGGRTGSISLLRDFNRPGS